MAEKEAQVVGLAGLCTTHELPKGGEIEPVVVTAALRSRGIGTRLIEYGINEARKQGVRFLRIRPVARNEKAFSLYVRLGFDLVGNIDLVQDLAITSNRKWKTGIKILGHELRY